MDPRVRKLTRLLKDRDLAETLVEAGLDSPKKIRQATDKDVEKALGKSGKGKVRERFK